MRLRRRTIPSLPACNCSIACLHQRTVEYTLGDQVQNKTLEKARFSFPLDPSTYISRFL
ncbi:hypothetical protein RchiOBHm_Chr1g0341671 [Rosa chinensis]|uniref:Uncharacterized protein n=1 Tax=Rosa chinensis TaxID=74649 RepID=A0A2P6SDT7_ROSCH|nr:hypothetical protein RchiOBHm_Chr1g0341671 [Rosa chinensis]